MRASSALHARSILLTSCIASCALIPAASGATPAAAAIGPRSAPVTATRSADHWTRYLVRVGSFSAVSCAERRFCVAVGHTNGADASTVFAGRSWSSPTPVGEYEGVLESITCPVAGWCMAITDELAVTTLHDGAWSKPRTVDPTSGPPYPGVSAAVSCASLRFCVAVDGQGNAEIFDGRSWSRPHLVDARYPMNAVSCASTSHCLAADGGGRVLTLSDGHWSAPREIDHDALDSISCGSASFCVATDAAGRFVTEHGDHWSAPVAVDELAASPVAVSCLGQQDCAIADALGRVATLAGGHWSPPVLVDNAPSGAGTFTSIACPKLGTGFCAAVDAAGFAFTDPDTFAPAR
jgi:hypothetical protein